MVSKNSQKLNNSFIRAEGFNTPPPVAFSMVLNPECNTLLEQHTPPNRRFELAAGLLILTANLRFIHKPKRTIKILRTISFCCLCSAVFFIFSFLFVTCKSAPVVPESFMQGERYLPLEKGASVYLFANVIEARSLLNLLPIEELKNEQTSDLLDRTGMAVAALFPQESGRRFQLAAWGNYPSFGAGFAFTFDRNWAKRRSSSGGSYWYSEAGRLSIVVTSKQSYAAASLNSTPFEPQTAATSQTGAEIPDGFNDFRADSPLSCWLIEPAKVISRIFNDAGIPIQFPVQQLFINIFPIEKGAGGYEAILMFQLESSVQARGMAAMLNLAGSFISGDSGLIFTPLLFANTPVQRDKYLEIKTANLNDKQILQVFSMFFGI